MPISRQVLTKARSAQVALIPNEQSKKPQVEIQSQAANMQSVLDQTDKLPHSSTLESMMRKEITTAVAQNRGVADLRVLKAVSAVMFSNPYFGQLIESEFGFVIDRGLGIYLRAVGIVLEAMFSLYLVGNGFFKVSMLFSRFIYNIVYYSCWVSVMVVHGVTYHIPKWLVKKIRGRASSKGNKTKVIIAPIAPAA